jgi:hypothetical protein
MTTTKRTGLLVALVGLGLLALDSPASARAKLASPDEFRVRLAKSSSAPTPIP